MILSWIYLVNIICEYLRVKRPSYLISGAERDGIFVAFTLPLIPHKFAWQSYRGRFTKQRYRKKKALNEMGYRLT